VEQSRGEGGKFTREGGGKHLGKKGAVHLAQSMKAAFQAGKYETMTCEAQDGDWRKIRREKCLGERGSFR